MEEINSITEIQDIGNFKVSPFEAKLDDTFVKLKLNKAEQMHISSALSQLPQAIASGAMSNMYYLSFPDGIQHTLMNLSQGGQASVWVRPDGKIGGTASLYNASASAALLGVFTAMSIASSQYFLTQINNELKMLNYKIDKILAFLYGDKKAELLSELRFVSYSYQNYNSIMHHEQQRIATLIGLQESRKVAMKDIEFYIQDLNTTVNSEIKGGNQLKETVDSCIQIRDSLNLSLQLYTMCSVLEAHYAWNADEEYIHNIENDLISYSDKCRDRMLDCFGNLKGRVNNYKAALPFKGNVDKSGLEVQISSLVEDMHNNEASIDRKKISDMLKLVECQNNYVIDSNGEVYCKIT